MGTVGLLAKVYQGRVWSHKGLFITVRFSGMACPFQTQVFQNPGEWLGDHLLLNINPPAMSCLLLSSSFGQTSSVLSAM